MMPEKERFYSNVVASGLTATIAGFGIGVRRGVVSL
jgi:hypothetical protein